MERQFDPYSAGGGSSDLVEQPYAGPTEEIGSTIAEQIEMMRRALQYRSRFESLPRTDAGEKL